MRRVLPRYKFFVEPPEGSWMSKWSDFKLSDEQKAYAEWLLLPTFGRPESEPKSKHAYARERGVSISTLMTWQRRDDFREYLAHLSKEKSLDPVKVHDVIESVYQAAINGDTKAMALYLQHADKLAPQRIAIEDKRIEQLSDEEFEQELSQVLRGNGVED